MDNAEAEELGEFRRLIERASLDQLAPLIIVSLDGLIDALREFMPSGVAIETAAALSAELHKRQKREPVAWAAVVGNA